MFYKYVLRNGIYEKKKTRLFIKFTCDIHDYWSNSLKYGS